MSSNQAFHLWGLVCFLTAGTIVFTTKNPDIVIEVVEREKVVYHERYSCVNDIDCFLLAEAIYHEARGEQMSGQVAVAHVIMNRVSSRYFPSTVGDVLSQGCQFSYRCDGSRKRGISDMRAFQRAVIVAEGVMGKAIPDPTRGSDHYLNPSKLERIPTWAEVYDHTITLDNHTFYRRG